MSKTTMEMLTDLLNEFDKLEHLKSSDIPGIDLYMDQVTTFMEDHLKGTARDPINDKIMTKTMINNYAKNKILPPPLKKKYSKEHMLFLIFIYYYKNVLSITDINTLFGPIRDKYFGKTGEFGIAEIYDRVANMCRDDMEALKAGIIAKYEETEHAFDDVASEDSDFLRRFALISKLSYDVTVKTLLIERMLDRMADETKR